MVTCHTFQNHHIKLHFQLRIQLSADPKANPPNHHWVQIISGSNFQQIQSQVDPITSGSNHQGIQSSVDPIFSSGQSQWVTIISRSNSHWIQSSVNPITIANLIIRCCNYPQIQLLAGPFSTVAIVSGGHHQQAQLPVGAIISRCQLSGDLSLERAIISESIINRCNFQQVLIVNGC